MAKSLLFSFAIFMLLMIAYIFFYPFESRNLSVDEPRPEYQIIKDTMGNFTYRVQCIDGVKYFRNTHGITAKYNRETLQVERCE